MSTEWTPEPARADVADGVADGTPVERYVLNGPTMGTRWSAVFYATSGRRTDRLATALQKAVDQVDQQMSARNPDSDIRRLNRAAVGTAVKLPPELLEVLTVAFEIGQDSGGAFDVGVGELAEAWGSRPDGARPDTLSVAGSAAEARRPAHEVVILDRSSGTATKVQPIGLDLSAIAKGYGVDRLARALLAAGVSSYLVSIDGELVARGRKPGQLPWTVAVERPDSSQRDMATTIGLEDAALATSGDHRHRRGRDGGARSQTLDPRTDRPLENDLAAVTVLAPTCMEADAWATALLVLGLERGQKFAAACGLEAMFMTRGGAGPA